MKVPKRESTMSHWILSGGDKTDLSHFESDKGTDSRRLRNSGLPVADDLEVPLIDFKEDNPVLSEFLSKYKQFVFRAVPPPQLPRKPKKGVRNYAECMSFFEEEVLPDWEERVGKRKLQEYFPETKVIISEYELGKRSGIIFSSNKKVIAEVGGDLEEFSHGGEPFASCLIDLTGLGHRENKTTWPLEGRLTDRNLIGKALRCIELTRDNFNPYFMRGYFELVETKSGKIRFVDYKTNEGYLS